MKQIRLEGSISPRLEVPLARCVVAAQDGNQILDLVIRLGQRLLVGRSPTGECQPSCQPSVKHTILPTVPRGH